MCQAFFPLIQGISDQYGTIIDYITACSTNHYHIYASCSLKQLSYPDLLSLKSISIALKSKSTDPRIDASLPYALPYPILLVSHICLLLLKIAGTYG